MKYNMPNWYYYYFFGLPKIRVVGPIQQIKLPSPYYSRYEIEKLYKTDAATTIKKIKNVFKKRNTRNC